MCGVFITLWEVHRGPEILSAWDDGYLVKRVGVVDHDIEQGVTCLVPGGRGLLLFAHCHAAAFLTPAHLVPGLLQIALLDGFLSLAGGHQCGFIKYIGKFGTRISGSATGDQTQIYCF